MNLLTIDIGNSSIKSALFKLDELNNYKIFKNVDLLIKNYSSKKIDYYAISSVVPKIEEELLKKLKAISTAKPFIITKKSSFNLKINYKTINTLGIDRICSIEGAYDLYRKSEEFKNYDEKTFVISIDCGTAITINIVKFNAQFIGGLISPGSEMMFKSLNKNTAQLPKVTANDYKQLIGDSTKSSIASGVINSNLGLMEKTMDHLRKTEDAKKIKIYLTGRNAKALIPNINFDFVFEKALVLHGIKAIFEKQKV